MLVWDVRMFECFLIVMLMIFICWWIFLSDLCWVFLLLVSVELRIGELMVLVVDIFEFSFIEELNCSVGGDDDGEMIFIEWIEGWVDDVGGFVFEGLVEVFEGFVDGLEGLDIDECCVDF